MTHFIEIFDNALDRQTCEAIVAQFRTCGQQQDGSTGGGINKSFKESQDVNITRSPGWESLHKQVMGCVTEHLFAYMKKYPQLLTGAVVMGRTNPETGQSKPYTVDDLDDASISTLMMKLYRPGDIHAQWYRQGTGGYHHWHSEIYPRDATCETLHRVLLFMYYLNTVDEGGETEFLFQKQRIKPQQGRMVIAPAGFTHTHKGHVPQSGDKLILTSWVLFNRAEALYK